MSPPRRVGSPTSKRRGQILDAAEQLLTEEGYAAVTSRSIATKAAIHASLVHYYFPTLDDLFVAMITRGSDLYLERVERALASQQPLLELWRLSSDRQRVTLQTELRAAANHRKVLRAQMSALAQAARHMQLEALRQLLPQYDLDEERFPAALVAAAIQGVALLVVREESLGDSTEQDPAAAAVETLIEGLEKRRSEALRGGVRGGGAPKGRSKATND